MHVKTNAKSQQLQKTQVFQKPNQTQNTKPKTTLSKVQSWQFGGEHGKNKPSCKLPQMLRSRLGSMGLKSRSGPSGKCNWAALNASRKSKRLLELHERDQKMILVTTTWQSKKTNPLKFLKPGQKLEELPWAEGCETSDEEVQAAPPQQALVVPEEPEVQAAPQHQVLVAPGEQVTRW